MLHTHVSVLHALLFSIGVHTAWNFDSCTAVHFSTLCCTYARCAVLHRSLMFHPLCLHSSDARVQSYAKDNHAVTLPFVGYCNIISKVVVVVEHRQAL